MWNLKSIRQPLDIVHNGTWDVCYAHVPPFPGHAEITIEYNPSYPSGLQSSVETNLCLTTYLLSNPDKKNSGYKNGMIESIVVDDAGEHDVTYKTLPHKVGVAYVNPDMAIRYHNQYGATIYKNGEKIN